MASQAEVSVVDKYLLSATNYGSWHEPKVGGNLVKIYAVLRPL